VWWLNRHAIEAATRSAAGRHGERALLTSAGRKLNTMLIYLSLFVCLIGAFVYALAANPKAAELGLCAYECGLLAFLLQLAPKFVDLFKG
jgi:hypothetical protein